MKKVTVCYLVFLTVALSGRGGNQGGVSKPEPTGNPDAPCVRLVYDQRVNGYDVVATWRPYCLEGKPDHSPIYFEFNGEDGNSFGVSCDRFTDSLLYYNCTIPDGGILHVKYIRPKDGEYLPHATPFHFADINFDGRDELIINQYLCGIRNSNLYFVYELIDGKPLPLSDIPFQDLMDDFSYVNPADSTITFLSSTSGDLSELCDVFQTYKFKDGNAVLLQEDYLPYDKLDVDDYVTTVYYDGIDRNVVRIDGPYSEELAERHSTHVITRGKRVIKEGGNMNYRRIINSW